jgi:hypothetical protein
MKFRALTATSDRRLTKNKIYSGEIVSTPKGVRVYITDNTGGKMTFDPRVFTVFDLDRYKNDKSMSWVVAP